MRLKAEINELSPGQWRHAQEVLLTSYDIRDSATRVCLTLVHGEEERHVELPVAVFIAVMSGLSMISATEKLSAARAILTPDDDRLPNNERRYDPDFGDRLSNGAYDRDRDT